MASNIIKYLIVMLVVSVSTHSFGQKEWDSIKVIGNNTGEKSMSQKSLIEVFRGQKNYWETNEGVLLILPSDKHPGAGIASAILYDMSISEMQKFWLAMVFQGRTNPPVFELNNADILKIVSETPGAIGILINYQGQIPPELLINIQ